MCVNADTLRQGKLLQNQYPALVHGKWAIIYRLLSFFLVQIEYETTVIPKFGRITGVGRAVIIPPQ